MASRGSWPLPPKLDTADLESAKLGKPRHDKADFSVQSSPPDYSGIDGFLFIPGILLLITPLYSLRNLVFFIGILSGDGALSQGAAQYPDPDALRYYYGFVVVFEVVLVMACCFLMPSFFRHKRTLPSAITKLYAYQIGYLSLNALLYHQVFWQEPFPGKDTLPLIVSLLLTGGLIVYFKRATRVKKTFVK